MTRTPRPRRCPGLTVCSLCTGETLEGVDPRPDGQLGRLRELEEQGLTRLTLVECLDECERGDVVVARPLTAARAEGARPVWFERLAGDDATQALAGWLAEGGPGRSALPDALEAFVLARQGPDADVVPTAPPADPACC